ncbi:hypothetical protein SAMN06265222_110170 [Neorhodopirellula lusitana]|uniref:Uncharacterized protein n=1 Tax=Neorhodopirellula lusitana TaxID=445327 RepID=A0ABY1QCP1_9BACT|nr:hypothetical protein [Neorhodopirellula lusitana]SMP67415.1 hypothetical protein SAMN06265222_110170 [Neorhodopirellula lusitana]
MTKRNRRLAIRLAICLIVGFGLWGLPRLASYVGATRRVAVPLKPGNVKAPTQRSIEWRDSSELTEKILQYWSAKPLGDWQSKGKIDIPRALMARFMLRQDLDAANAFFVKQEPWGNPGSTWAGHPNGDYDFTLAGLTPILFLFGEDPETLYPETRDHLIKTLLPLDGGDPIVTVPRTFGLVPDTENHLLMTEGSRYLKNRWLMQHGSQLPKHDNIANGLEAWLLNLIEELRSAGLYEFNSIPYEGYTLTALLNLEAFGSAEVQASARELLDQLNWAYALSSLSFRRYPPFRRQYKHAGDTSLSGDRHVALIKPWISLLPEGPTGLRLKQSQHIAIWACWSTYRLPDQTAKWIVNKPSNYFVRFGHGPDSSPEIYSGGPGYLLSAGGVNRGSQSLIVARPITLMLDDGANDLSKVLHLSGPGEDFRHWNNTGVWKRFAVAAGPVQIPANWRPDAQSDLWAVYHRDQGQCIGVHSNKSLGLVHLVHSDDPKQALAQLQEANPNAKRLQTTFKIPGGERIHYDVHAEHDRWVIQQVDNQIIDRNYDQWPAMQGTLNDMPCAN